MKKTISVLPFALVLTMLLGSVLVARAIHAKAQNFYPVNTTADSEGRVRTVRVFESISKVVAVDIKNKARKKSLSAADCSYNSDTTELFLPKDFVPFENTVFHIEGRAAQPEIFFLYDFEGTSDALLVLLSGREAIEGLEYSYDPQSRKLIFRNDIHPEKDGKFHIMYKTKDGATHGFGNWANDDALAALQWKWVNKNHGAPMMAMKDRSAASNKKLSKEIGFKIELPKGSATFICESMEESKKKISVMRWYDDKDLMVECKPDPFLLGNDVRSAERTRMITLGKQEALRQKIIGSQTTADGGSVPIPLVVYTWNKSGTHYQLSVEDEKVSIAEGFIERLK